METKILKEVYNLAKIKHRNCLNSNPTSLDNAFDIVNYNRIEKSKLFQYLETLTYEQNLTILTIAYIGRGDCNEEFEKHIDIKKIYEDMFDYVKDTFPTNEVTILQIHQKLPLDEYLKKGFELLQIKI